MKKLLISILACSMIITGCSKKESKSKTKTEEVVEVSEEDLELLFEEDDEYKDLKEEYNITSYETVDENNSDSLLDKIDQAVNDHKDVIIEIGLGIVVIACVAYVIYNPAIVTTLVSHIKALMKTATAQKVIKLVESGTIWTFFEYIKTKDLKESIKSGADHTINKLQGLVSGLV